MFFVASTANYKFCGAEVLPSFSCHDVMKAPDMEGNIERLRKHLAAIIDKDGYPSDEVDRWISPHTGNDWYVVQNGHS